MGGFCANTVSALQAWQAGIQEGQCQMGLFVVCLFLVTPLVNKLSSCSGIAQYNR